ncbi:hypothetical protein IV203_001414 [Nitzschia inconspicua]|uniref:Uncharacterized protein n=1 Tax=Nitzschia inconspicua TaxID=303405 RepID=A0A9K3PRK8_9STRA|nr:hypothetical protein IV203_001414 [Nitzschia inconspicua]
MSENSPDRGDPEPIIETKSLEDGTDNLSLNASSSSIMEETKTPSPPRPPIAPSNATTTTATILTSPSYVSSASSPSPTGARPSINISNTFGSTEVKERGTINSDVSIFRKDSDDVSLSKIKPVHNFFSQQQQFGYDSDGSDGSLVFSPPSFDDQKSTVVRGGTSKKGGGGIPRRTDTATASNRERTHSTESNGSIRYIHHSPQQQTATVSLPSNPQMLPYHERKLMQQKQQEQYLQAQQQQLQMHYQYQAAVLMQQQQQAAQMQQQQQQQVKQQESPQLQPQGPPQLQSHPAQAFGLDPRMVAAYYQMYGMSPPPTQPGMFPPMHAHHELSSQAGYQYSPPSPYLAPTPIMQPVQQPGQQQQASQQQHQQAQSLPQYPNLAYPPTYQGFPIPGHEHMPLPYYGYVPNPMAQSPPAPSGQQPELTHGNPANEPPTQTPKTANNSKQLYKARSLPLSGTSPSTILTTGVTNTKNPPRPPPKATTNRLHHRTNSFGSVPPPPPSPLPAQSKVGGHSRVESYGSMSSLGSYGPVGISAGSFSRDEDDEPPVGLPPPPPPLSLIPKSKPPPPPLKQAPPAPSQAPSQSSKSTSQKSKPSAPAAPPAFPPPPTKRTIDEDADSASTPETPRDVVHARKHSFLDRIRMNWSPQSRDSPSGSTRKKHNLDDFHRRNQEFLNRSTVVPTFPPSPSRVRHHRVASQDRPPASRGTHRRLTSISNDEWDDTSEKDTTSGEDKKPQGNPAVIAGNKSSSQQKAPPSASLPSYGTNASEDTSESGSIYDDGRYTSDSDTNEDAHERTSLLPPSGISTNENDEKDSKYGRDKRYSNQKYASAASERKHQHHPSRGQVPTPSPASISESSSLFESDAVVTDRWDHRAAQLGKTKKKKYRRRNLKQRSQDDDSDGNGSSTDEEDALDYRQWTKSRQRKLEKERSKYIEQWKAEARAEADLKRQQEESNQIHRRCWRSIAIMFQKIGFEAFRMMTYLEAFIGNLPLTICAVAMAVVTLGVVWFKFAEEYLDTCEPVHFHSSQCTFPEFPGCFYCDTSAVGYKIAVGFHYGCKVASGFLVLLVVAKILLATRVVIDEMSSPTTSSPAGLLCMTAVCVFAGRGLIGQIIVSSAACVHLGLAIWFIYMALAYHIMPEPSWFPNTVGIGISAIKTWLYYPMPGHLLMAISLSLNFFFFPISLIRVAVNKKISATVGWMQMSAPAVSLYSLTIMAQPSFEEEHPDVTDFQRVHRMVYLPCMHVMCALSILGMAASVHSLYVRWPEFKNKEFSPAHAAFCFPTLSHANSIQAYRGAVRSFSDITARSWRMVLLDTYWITVLVAGTIATFWICGKFMCKLPEWTSPDLSDEEEPPAPYDTLMSRQDMVTAGDVLTQTFVSPAILQANETGALIVYRSTRDGTLRYVRTRRIRALGFEPTMNWSEMQAEREVLLEWARNHPARRRHRTLSVPGIDFNYGSSFGTGNSGVYGSIAPSPIPSRRRFMSQGGDRGFF